MALTTVQTMYHVGNMLTEGGTMDKCNFKWNNTTVGWLVYGA